MQHPRGYFYFRQYPMIKAKTPYIHWGQATMFKALSHLLLAMEIQNETHSAAESGARMAS